MNDKRQAQGARCMAQGKTFNNQILRYETLAHALTPTLTLFKSWIKIKRKIKSKIKNGAGWNPESFVFNWTLKVGSSMLGVRLFNFKGVFHVF